MKKLLAACLVLFAAYPLSAQAPLIQWAHQYANSADEGSSYISKLRLENNDMVSVYGSFLDDVEVEIGPGNSSVYGIESLTGLRLKYDTGDALISAWAYGLSVEDGFELGDDVISIGRFDSLTHIEPGNDNPQYFNPMEGLFGNHFVARHNMEGALQWTSFTNGNFISLTKVEDYIYVVGICASCEIYNLQDTVMIDDLDTISADGMIAVYDLTGNLVDHKVLGSPSGDRLKDSDYCPATLEFGTCGRFQGTTDFQWNGSEPVVVEWEGQAATAVTYNTNQEVTSVFVISNQGGNNGDYAESNAIAYDADGNLYVGATLEQGSYTLNLNDYEEELLVSSAYEMILAKISVNKELLWYERISVTGETPQINNIFIDHNGFVNICGQFDDNVDFLLGGPDFQVSSNSGFLARWRPDGALVWAYTISEGGVNSVNDIIVTPGNDMYIGGMFTNNSEDFDLSENGTYYLGDVDGENGYLAKYAITDPEADIMVEQGWQQTHTAEDGMTDVIYVRLAGVPTASVNVTLIPGPQLDLGAGAGVAVTLTFEANNTAVLQQEVVITALDDLVIEGAHSEIIMFNMSSEDPAYDVLAESPVNVTIADNDVINITELNKLDVAISPNPASDEVNIVLSKPGKTVIQLIDDQGRSVLEETTSGSIHRLVITHLPAGLYTIVIQQGSLSSTSRFVVQ